MKYILSVLLFLIYIFSGTANASFTDDFTDPTYVDWNIVSGTWTDSGSMQVTVAGNIFRTIGYDRNPNYISIIINRTGSGVGTDEIAYYRDSGVKACILSFTPSTGQLVGFAAQGAVVCPTVPTVTIKLNNQFRIESTIQSSNSITYTVTNITSGNNTIVTTSLVSGNPFNGGVVDSNRFYVTLTTLSTSLYHLVVSNVSSASTSISWGASEYTQGAYPSFTWQISDSDWTTQNCGIWPILWVPSFFAVWKLNGQIVGPIMGDSSIAVSQTGTYSISAAQTGSYTIELVSSCYFTPELGTTITSDNMNVRPPTTPRLQIDRNPPLKTNVSASYDTGYGISAFIELRYLNNGIEETEMSYLVCTATIACSGSRNITFNRLGTYNVYLVRAGTNPAFPDIPSTLAVTTVTTVFIPQTAQNNYDRSNISIRDGRTDFSMNDMLNGNYTIEGKNFSQGVQFIDIYNVDSRAETVIFYKDGFGNSIGQRDNGLYSFQIINQPAIPGHPEVRWMPGNNKVRLMMQYGSNGTIVELANTTFYLSSLNVAGYGLLVSPKSVLVNEVVTVTTTSPTIGASLHVTSSDVLATQFEPQNITIPQGNLTTQYKFKNPGTYAFYVYDPTGAQQLSDMVTVSASVTPTPTPPSQGAAGETSTNLYSIIDTWVRNLGYGLNNQARFLFAIIIIAIFIIAGKVLTGDRDSAIIAGFLPFAFFSYITVTNTTPGVEYVPKWTMIIFILLIARAIKIFR